MIVFASKINENILPLPPQINYMQSSDTKIELLCLPQPVLGIWVV